MYFHSVLGLWENKIIRTNFYNLIYYFNTEASMRFWYQTLKSVDFLK